MFSIDIYVLMNVWPRVVTLNKLTASDSSLRSELLHSLKQWGCVLYPTDTVYGVWTIDTPEFRTRVGEFKDRDMGAIPYSVIAPSYKRIDQTYEMTDWSAKQIWNKHTQRFQWRWITCVFGHDRPWVRYLWEHPMQILVTELWVPLITTSANLRGYPTISSYAEFELYETTKKALIDRRVDWWVLAWASSVLIDVINDRILRQ